MKKLIVFLMCVFAVSSVHAFDADECTAAGGTVITRNVNGATNAPSKCDADKCPATTKTFCRSSQTMNWWTAFNWCDSIGGSLASFGEMCPKVQTAVNNTTGACPGLQGKGSNWVWSSLGYGSNLAIVVNLSSGEVYNATRRSYDYAFALCE